MFLPTLFGQVKPLPDELGELVTLTRARGLGIPDSTTEASQQYSAPKTFTKQHVESIKFQSGIQMSRCKMFMRHLAENLADKDVEGPVKSCKEGVRA